MNFLYSIAPNLENLQSELIKCFFQTIQMCAVSGVIAFIIGLFFGVLLIVTKRGGIMQCTPVYTIINRAPATQTANDLPINFGIVVS